MYRAATQGKIGARLDIFFAARTWSGEPVNREPNQCHGILWLPLDRLSERIPGYVRAAIERSQQGDRYSEFDWE